jgi:hypothetical protein
MQNKSQLLTIEPVDCSNKQVCFQSAFARKWYLHMLILSSCLFIVFQIHSGHMLWNHYSKVAFMGCNMWEWINVRVVCRPYVEMQIVKFFHWLSVGISVSNPNVMGHQAAIENCCSNFHAMLALLGTGPMYQSCPRFHDGKGDCKWSVEASLQLIDTSVKNYFP